jgi:hypothetical protein
MKTFKQHLKEMGTGAVGIPGPTNVVGSGNIAGTGGPGGEPGVDTKKKRKSPILMSLKRK